MWKSVNKIVAFTVALVCLAGGAFAADVKPFNFPNIEDEQQQEYWEFLMNFKLWATEGFDIGKLELRDSSGWTGSASGGLKAKEGGEQVKLGGPIILGGALNLFAQDSLLNGPIRIEGDFNAGMNNGTGNFFKGPVCVSHSVNTNAQNGIRGTLLTGANAHTGVCSDLNVAAVREDLKIPEVEGLMDKTVNSEVYAHSDKVLYIDVPPDTTVGKDEKMGVYDIFLDEIRMGNENTLYVRMPAKGRLTRIFLKNGFVFGTHPVIAVMYGDGEFDFTNRRYKSYDGVRVENDQYFGNLLFYTNKDISFANSDNHPIQGTYITTGKITLPSNFTFAGQLLAKKIEIGHDFKGDFRYVRFDPPTVVISSISNTVLYESDELDTIPVRLDTIAETNVFIEYCYMEAKDATKKAYNYNWADSSDLLSIENDMPICVEDPSSHKVVPKEGSKTKTIVIPAGFNAPQDSANMAWIRVKKDTLDDNNELMFFQVVSISGAVFETNRQEGGAAFTILDRENTSPTFAKNSRNLSVKENDPYPSDPVGVIVATDAETLLGMTFELFGSSADTFEIEKTGEINGDSVYAKVYVKPGIVFDYETQEPLKINVRVTDKDNASATKTFTVNIIDVNETPIVKDSTYKKVVKENRAVDSKRKVADILWDDTDVGYGNNVMEARAHGFRYNWVKIERCANEMGKEFDVETECPFDVEATEQFQKVSGSSDVPYTENGILKLIRPLDYEQDSIYELKVIVYDKDDPSLLDSAFLTLTIQDEDDRPKIDTLPPDTTIVKVDGDTLKLKNIKNAGVEENNPAGALVGKVFGKSTDAKKSLRYVLEKDTSGLFEMDPTGIISVKDALVLDYETVSRYEVTVSVFDGIDEDGDGLDDVKGFKIQSDTKTFIINVIDVDEKPSLADTTFQVLESEAVYAGVSVGGKLVAADEDTEPYFKQHRFNALECEYNGVTSRTDVLTVSSKNSKGSIKTVVPLDYEKFAAAGDTVFTLVVEVVDVIDSSLRDTAIVTVELLDANDPPELVSTSFTVREDAVSPTLVGVLEATDPDGDEDELKFTLAEPSSKFEVSSSGSITVKKGAKLDYETNQKEILKVTVTDEGGLSSTANIVINIEDVNEPPTLPDQTITVREDTKIGTEIGVVKGYDPDVLTKEFSTLTYTLIGKSDVFQILPDGTIKLIDTLDYEKKTSYVLDVSVSDGEYADSGKVTIKVGNVVEKSEVKITQVDHGDSTWKYPDTLYVGAPDVKIYWTEDGRKFDVDTTLTEGRNVIIKKYKDSTKDLPGADTVVIFVNTSIPKVYISKSHEKERDANIFTVVEPQDKSDTSFYVNDPKSPVLVTVEDESDKNASKTFTVNLKLDSIKVPASVFKTKMSNFVDAGLMLNEMPSSKKSTSVVNGDWIRTTYTEIVNGDSLTISYDSDHKGNVLKTEIVNEKGKIKKIEAIKVTYKTKVAGKVVEVSYWADANTGALVTPRDGSSYQVSYTYVDEAKNEVLVTYGVDENGKFVKNSEGNMGYNLSYSYTNRYGNTGVRSLFVVLDEIPPVVKILSPEQDQVLHSNFVDVVWTVNGETQDSLSTQSLDKGSKAIVRYYRDKAGNEAGDTVFVILKNSKDIDLTLEKPVTELTREKVEEYYSEREPAKNQTFAVSIYNTKTDEEVETLIGGKFKTKDGSGEEPYPGLKGHLGPTVKIDVKAPVVNVVRGLATLDDLAGKDGLISLEGVDAAGSEKVTLDDYVNEYCTDEFKEKHGSDAFSENLFNTKMRVKVWVYTNLGQFVDFYDFTQPLNNPEYVNDAGVLSLYFELKPDHDGLVHAKNGTAYATGAYLFKSEVEMRSSLRCTLPPLKGDNVNPANRKGATRKTTSDMLKPFGYKRPSNETNEREE